MTRYSRPPVAFSAGLMFTAVIFMQLLVVQSSAQSADETDAQTSTSAWHVRCNDSGSGMRCRASQTIALRKSRKRLLAVRVTRPSDAKAAMMMHLPHGLFLPAGVSWQVDDAARGELTVQTCDKRGCYAGMALSAQRLEALKRGARLTLSFQNLEKRTVRVPVSLKGFTAAIAKL